MCFVPGQLLQSMPVTVLLPTRPLLLLPRLFFPLHLEARHVVAQLLRVGDDPRRGLRERGERGVPREEGLGAARCLALCPSILGH